MGALVFGICFFGFIALAGAAQYAFVRFTDWYYGGRK